jgi:hypothetical protein
MRIHSLDGKKAWHFVLSQHRPSWQSFEWIEAPLTEMSFGDRRALGSAE